MFQRARESLKSRQYLQLMNCPRNFLRFSKDGPFATYFCMLALSGVGVYRVNLQKRGWLLFGALMVLLK